MLSTIETINQVVNDFIWGVPAMVCIIGVGFYLSCRTGFCRSASSPMPSRLPSEGCSAREMLLTER